MKKRETKLQVQSILATVVMGMNLVNTAAPAVAVAMTEQQEPEMIKAKYQEIQELYPQVGFFLGQQLSNFLTKQT